MTRDQKEKYVIQLYTEGKRHKEEIEGQDGQLEERYDDIKSKSKTTQAIKLFSEGKSPVDVAIELDLPADEVRAIYREFLE